MGTTQTKAKLAAALEDAQEAKEELITAINEIVHEADWKASAKVRRIGEILEAEEEAEEDEEEEEEEDDEEE